MRVAGRGVAALAVAVASVAVSPSGAGDAIRGWTTYGNGGQRAGAASVVRGTSLRHLFTLNLRGRITAQVLAASAAGSRDTTLYVGTSLGRVYAVDGRGRIRWQRAFGQLRTDCPQLDGYGITGTPVIDPTRATLYVADAHGFLHALALADGRERAGWPVRLYQDDRAELVWGALSLGDGRVYVPTASYCDEGGEGKVIAVDERVRSVSTWISVPSTLGGGGGVWGWGGVAYSSALRRLFVVTANAQEGGTNVGAGYRESAGFGERLVVLSPALSVLAANHPRDIPARGDLDFGGSPVLFTIPRCGRLVAATSKTGTLYVWRSGRVGSGPMSSLSISRLSAERPFLGQLAWDASLRSLVAVTNTHVVRIGFDHCRLRRVFSRSLATNYENGSPTVSGTVAWFAVGRGPALLAVDLRTGRIRSRTRLGTAALSAPTIVGDRLFVGSFTGRLYAFAIGSGRRTSN